MLVGPDIDVVGDVGHPYRHALEPQLNIMLVVLVMLAVAAGSLRPGVVAVRAERADDLHHRHPHRAFLNAGQGDVLAGVVVGGNVLLVRLGTGVVLDIDRAAQVVELYHFVSLLLA